MAISIILLAICSCVKEQEDSSILASIDKSLNPYLFNTGSYWVYDKVNPLITDTIKTVPKDSLELPKDSIITYRDSIIIQDSVSVKAIEKDTLYITGNVRYYEYYKIKYHSSLENMLWEENLIGYVISRGLMNGGFTFLSSKKKNDKSMNATILDVMDEMKVEDRTFKKVVKMKVLKDQYISGNYYFYYVENIGIIRKENIEVIKKGNTVKDSVTQTWNLNHYKVNLLKLQ